MILQSLSLDAQKALEGIRTGFPKREWEAVSAWLSTFYPYQLEWILDWSRFSLLNKARQIGASHSYAASSVLWGMLGETTTVISVGEREAGEVLAKADRHLTALTMLGSQWAVPVGRSRESLRMKSGGRVLALPATSGGRSFSGNVLLDEFAYHQRPEEVWDGAGGTVLHGYKLRVMSTPNGIGNLWYELWNDPKQHKGYRLHEVTLDDAMRDGLRVSVEACWKQARNDPRIFDQLFRCKFLDNDMQYIPSELLRAAQVERDQLPDEGPCYAGIDIGETRDRTVLVVVRRKSKTRAVVHVESHQRTDDDLLDSLASKAITQYGAKRVCIDATGMGSIPAHRMRKKFGGSLIEPIWFTNEVKEDLATGLYAVVAGGELMLPREYRFGAEDEAQLLRDDVCSIRRTVTAAGTVRYEAPRTSKGHADRAFALMLALFAARRGGDVDTKAPAVATYESPISY